VNPIDRKRRAPCVSLVLVGLASVLGGQRALAIPPPQPGSGPEFGISAEFMGAPRYLTETSILVMVWGAPQYDSLAVGDVQVELPPGFALVSGDTLRHVLISPYSRRPMSDLRWVVTIRPEQTGHKEVKLKLRIDGGPKQGVDETEFVMPMEVRTDSVRVVQPPHSIRLERVREGKRYRLADGYLVPIDTTEAFLESDIAVKPRVLSSTVAPRPPGSAFPAGGVPLVALVAKDGRLLGAELLEAPEGPTYDPRIIEAARSSIERWRFAPAQARGQPVPDYLVVRVQFGPAGSPEK